MTKIIIVVLASLIPLLPVGAYFMNRQTKNALKSTQDLVLAFKGYNLFIGFLALGLGAVWLFAAPPAYAAGVMQTVATGNKDFAKLAAGIAMGLGSIGAGIAVSGTGAAAVGAIAEKPEAFGRSLIFVGLAEGVALYGLIIAIIVLFT